MKPLPNKHPKYLQEEELVQRRDEAAWKKLQQHMSNTSPSVVPAELGHAKSSPPTLQNDPRSSPISSLSKPPSGLQHDTNSQSALPNGPKSARISGLPKSPLPYDQFYKEKMNESCLSKTFMMAKKHDKAESLSSPVHSDELVALSAEQRSVYDTVMHGDNVFITGSAGTGKSLLLKHICNGLSKKGSKFYITAPTGMAAVQVDGHTIHSWARIRTGDQGLDSLMIGANYNIEKVRPWHNVDVLIIDEISMVNFTPYERVISSN